MYSTRRAGWLAVCPELGMSLPHVGGAPATEVAEANVFQIDAAGLAGRKAG